MPLVTGRFYVFDFLNGPHANIIAAEASLTNAQSFLSSTTGRLAYDRAVNAQFHYEIYEKTASGFTRHDVYQS